MIIRPVSYKINLETGKKLSRFLIYYGEGREREMVDPKLTTFLTLVEEKTTVRCAEALHLSQPAVTQHIRALEAEYGVKLFAREGRRLTLTEAGGRF